MINNIIIVVAFVLATVHWSIRRKSCSREQVVDLYFMYFLFFTVGLIGGIGFVGHVFFANQTAKMIGWSPGSPFQFEVGFHDGAWAMLGILAIWLRGKFWLATALGWSFFMLGAAYGHVHQSVLHHDFAPYNAGIIVPDFAVPVILLVLTFLKFRVFARHTAS